MYSPAMSPPRAPVPRPSSRSLARNFTCARIFSGSTAAIACSAAEGSPATRGAVLVGFAARDSAGLFPACANSRLTAKVTSREMKTNLRINNISEEERKNAPSADGALELSHSRKLTDLGEDDNQGEQHQRLNEGQAQNQSHLNSRTRSRVSSHGLAGRGADPALSETGQTGRNRDAEAGGNRDKVVRWSSGGCALRVRWHGHHHDGQQRKDYDRQFSHFSFSL